MRCSWCKPCGASFCDCGTCENTECTTCFPDCKTALEEFATFVRDCGIDDAAIADEFSISIPSVARWKNGVSAPHKVMRKHVISGIKRLQREAFEKEEQKWSGGGVGEGSF